MPRPACSTDLRNDGEHHILTADTRAELAINSDAHGLGLFLPQALRGQHLLQVGRADAERVSTQCAMRGGMRVAAGHGQPRQCKAGLRADHMHDALIGVAHAKGAYAIVGAIGIKQANHLARVGVVHRGNALLTIARGHVVIAGGQMLARLAHLAALLGQRAECMKRAIVQQVAVDIDQRLRAFIDHYMLRPDFLEHRGHGLPLQISVKSHTTSPGLQPVLYRVWPHRVPSRANGCTSRHRWASRPRAWGAASRCPTPRGRGWHQ